VIQSKPLIITIPPENPAPAPSVSEAPTPPATEDAAKPANYLVIESETKPQLVDDAAVPSGYTVIESEVADTKPTAPPSSPSVPTVVIPPCKAMEEISSFQIGDVLIIAVRVQPAPTPEVEL
jgi:hypothetical protein